MLKFGYTVIMPRKSQIKSSADEPVEMTELGDYRTQVLANIRRIPPGRVATYGQIARLAGKPQAPRQVGNILSGLKPADGDVPWQRVVNAQGGVSPRLGYGAEIQRQLLEAEGVEFGSEEHCSLARYQWDGASKASKPAKSSKAKATPQADALPAAETKSKPRARAKAQSAPRKGQSRS